MNKQAFFENVTIITGASSGIGRQLALYLAKQGAWLSLAARNVEHLEEVSAKCLQLGGKVIIVPTDVAEKSQCQNLIERTIEQYGRIDTLINNAGFAITSRFDQYHDLSLYEKIIQVNFLGSVYCTYYSLPYIKKSKGRIVAISSLLGKLPSATADGYGASKHAMAEFFSSLRNELHKSGVSVTLIFPGFVSTGVSSRFLKADGMPTGKISIYEKGTMSTEKCATIIIKSAAGRKRDVVMTFEGKFGLLLKLIAPKLADHILRKRALLYSKDQKI
ncbi:MAG: SDR family oxidoreductase [Bacteroidota bacterium]